MKIIGITGGIGTGKSTVTDYILSKGYTVLDADKISRELTKGRSQTVMELAETFGNSILNDDGTLDRKGLAAIVFNDNDKKSQLERIVTDKVFQIIKDEIEKHKAENKEKLIFIDAPLLFETDVRKLPDYVWCVVADADIRISRVMARDNCTREQVLERMRNQMSDEEKISLSDEILDNSRGKEDLYKEIDGLLERYVKL